MPIGSLPGVPSGTSFADRKALRLAGVHRMNQAGIAGRASEPAESIVLNEGYEDDLDNGDVVVYTGQGGRDQNTGQQVADQELTKGNASLVHSHRDGLPVRVIRGPKLRSPLAPANGYRYDGLYAVERYWQDIGKSGFRIWRFELRRDDLERPLWTSPVILQPAPRVPTTVQRIVRNTSTAQQVKELHDYRCQVCGIRLELPSGPYAEAAHIRPLGRPHDGPDAMANILCLCPNHHVLFDDGAFAVTNELALIGSVTGPLRVAKTHSLHADFLDYHRRHFFDS